MQNILQVPKSYKNKYNDFKKKVLLVAQKELAEHCDICFTFNEEKTGRKVTRLVFRIHPNIKTINELSTTTTLFEIDYTDYYGKYCVVNNKFYNHIEIIKPYKNCSLLVMFKSGLFPNGRG